MSLATFDRSISADTLVDVIVAPVAMVSAAAKTGSKIVSRMRAEYQLQSLDDRLLEDIGLTRADIHDRVWGK